ncbi:radical SAM/SPASM domain-containing protein [Desulfurispora thermophila]|uniref:radical SAM/SPASM domain-containing protein n=1 Tax=Desulfurispora thermophila TaxID=265470 RepID=UPI00036D23EB|nr:radical SAM protein [Desulfurispora thermophila]
MISISRLYCGATGYGDTLRYAPGAAGARHGAVQGHGPVVVWNMTRSCNLHCRHCYSSSETKQYAGEMSTREGRQFIEQLAAFRVPVLLLSGGEPLTRPDFFDLVQYALQLGIRVTVSTNGTLITPDMARQLKQAGVGYVGISLDGLAEVNDRFRGRRGAFQMALDGIRNCLAAGQRVGLRFTINRHNYQQVDDIFHLVKEENISRICFYHLVYSGRGSSMVEEDISHQETRAVVDKIMAHTAALHASGRPVEVLTVDNHCDAIYLYLKLKEQDEQAAARARELLLVNGGNRSGVAIGAVDWAGNVYPDQFTRQHVLGNVLQTPFASIWQGDHPLLRGLRERKRLLKGRCAACRWLDYCNGNFRARAEAVTGDFWAADPACYLTDEEIGISTES